MVCSLGVRVPQCKARRRLHVLHVTHNTPYCVRVNMRMEHGRGRGVRRAGQTGNAERRLLTRPPRDLRGRAQRSATAGRRPAAARKAKKRLCDKIFFFFCLYHSLTAGKIGGWGIPARSRRPSEHTSFTTPFDWIPR